MTERYPLLTFTVMKNEGPFVLEWVAYQRVFGADRLLILTNDCDDGTDRLCERLMELGIAQHAPNPCAMGQKYVSKARHPHIVGLEFGRYFEAWKRAEYILLCDVDEFPVVHVGDGTVDALLDAAGAPDVVSLSERMFGADEHVAFDERPLIERFTRCSSSNPGRWRARKGLKSICRNDPRIDIRNHRPLVAPEVAADIRWVDGAGAPFPDEARAEHVKGLDVRGRYELGAIHHYVLRSMESFLVKVARGDAVAQYEDRLDYIYFKRRNRVDEENTAAHRLLPEVKAEIARMMRDERLAHLHWRAVRHHRAKIHALKEQPPFADLFAKICAEREKTRDVKRRKGEPISEGAA